MAVINQRISVNYTPGRGGNTVQFIVLHTVAGMAAGAIATFNNRDKARSAHDIITLNGDRIVCVDEGNTSWGAANWYVNERAINIEHEDNGNYNDPVRTNALYAASAARVADLCRRYGVPCELVTQFSSKEQGKAPAKPGIVLHKQVSISGTSCPDGLDITRIIRQAQAILGGAVLASSTVPVPPAIPAAGEPHVNYQPANQAVSVIVGTLLVRDLPTAESTPGQANTPDGNLHFGNTITITGFTHAQDPYGDGRDVWLRTIWGHWVWAAGTDFKAAAVAQAQAAAPAPTPTGTTADTPVDYIPYSGVVSVVVPAGLRVHVAPDSASALNDAHALNGALEAGTSFNITGYKAAQDPYGDGRNIWVRSTHGNWLWAGGTNFVPPVSSAPPTPVDTITSGPAPATAAELEAIKTTIAKAVDPSGFKFVTIMANLTQFGESILKVLAQITLGKK
jgi:hypothetical protein